MSLREAVCRSENLALAYERHARKRGLWAPGIPMTIVARNPVRAMLELAQEMRQGRYRPHPPRIVPIAKADGGTREIAVYMMRDRVAQRAVLQVVQQRTDRAMSACSFGYRPGRSVAAALNRVGAYLDESYTWIGDADIERCFNSIPRLPLLTQVQRRLGDPVAPIFVAHCLGWNREERRDGTGIPQGSGLAPWLCNIYLWQLDDTIWRAGIPMVRYADDFVVLARTREGADSALALCAETLGAMRLKLHPVKTRIVDAIGAFRFLGRSLTAQPKVPVQSAVA
jgi:group II intron reverse transcriptase/maturase